MTVLRLLEERPLIKEPRAREILCDEYGYDGSVDLVKREAARAAAAGDAAGAAG